LVACSAKIFNSQFDTYYIGSQNYKFNRIDEVNYLSDKFRTNQKNVLISGENFADQLLDTIKINENPLNHPSSVLRNYLYKQIGNEISAVLSGEGADCFYCGYYIFDLINYLYIKNPVRSLSHYLFFLLPVSLIPADYRSRIGKIKNLMILPPDRYAIFYDLLNSNSERGLKLLLDIDIPANFAENYTSPFSDYNEKTILNTILNIYQTHYIIESLMTLTKLGAANKIEHRHPFVENKMVDLFNSFSWQDKIGFFERKKQIVALGKRYLEKEFFAKRKEGFGVPLKDWFYDEKNLGKFLSVLSDKKTKERGIFNIKYLEKILDEFHHGKLSNDAFENILWPIINFELWYRLYIDKDL
jgi:asparagine synthase (glutamine-hydrolysing)